MASRIGKGPGCTGFAEVKRLNEKGKMRFSTEGGVLY